ncbi:MAG: L-ribulose-5-phosphate 4-epimerase AraD [Planctomycetota bacterium]
MNPLERLKSEVCQANRDLVRHALVVLTWGNVSAITPDRTRVVIKPSGVAYESLTASDMVVLDLDGRVVEGSLAPSTDTPTHLHLYRSFPGIGAIAHAHSPYATMFAQARREIPCLGTTHADHFLGPVPLARALTPKEAADDYELNTGRVIVERFATLNPVTTPGVLLAGHAPFVWGPTATKALENAVALEAIARIAHGTLALNTCVPLETHILTKHHDRKHGQSAYYGQPPKA